MQSIQWTGRLLVTALALCSGCGAAVLTVQHDLPAALPVAVEKLSVDRADFSVNDQTYTELLDYTIETLREQLGPSRRPSGDKTHGTVGHVGGRIEVQQSESRGSRWVLQRDPETKLMIKQKVPTLVRTASVRVEFVVQDASGRQLAAAELSRPYDSTQDPRVRGQLGLHRPDDPQRVPPAEKILKELLADCVRSFCEMITPTHLEVPIRLQPAAGPEANAAMEAVRAGRYAQAYALFGEALRADPGNPALMFNLAALAEKTGNLEAAARYYKASAQATGPQRKIAAQCARRVELILARLKTGR